MAPSDLLIQQRLAAEQATLDELGLRLAAEAAQYGFEHLHSVLAAGLHNHQLRLDGFDDNQSLYAEWRDDAAQCVGSVLIHGGGQVYATLDVIKDHPTDTQWFVEAITLWGRGGALKVELSLLPALND